MVEHTKDLLADAKHNDTLIHAPILQKPETPTSSLFKNWDNEVMEAKQHSQHPIETNTIQESVVHEQQSQHQQHTHLQHHQTTVHYHKPIYENLDAFEKQQQLIRRAVQEKQKEDVSLREVLENKLENLKEDLSTRVENTVETLAHQKEYRSNLFSELVDSLFIMIDTVSHPFGYMWEGWEDYSKEYRTKHAWTLK